MNYNKVIKDLKERNNTLAHQYRLRDMRCINLEQENERLNKQLNELQKSQIFIDTQDIEEEYGEGLYQDYLEEKNEELKKQLEEINKMIEKCGFVNIEQVMLNYCGLLTQQQEFIEYLTSYIELLNNKPDLVEEGQIDILKEILKKYKSIIGGNKDDK